MQWQSVDGVPPVGSRGEVPVRGLGDEVEIAFYGIVSPKLKELADIV